MEFRLLINSLHGRKTTQAYLNATNVITRVLKSKSEAESSQRRYMLEQRSKICNIIGFEDGGREANSQGM